RQFGAGVEDFTVCDFLLRQAVFSHALNLDDMRQFAELHDIELTVIDNDTRLPSFKDALRWNEVYYGSKR
ncbi:hypothetical protein FK514_29840, partial [Klebsiella pneumoniae]|uniref:hypothetical protein n=1 Tax=Klebsiella pneumoniae TaxID=573 RepID=UPI00210BB0C8